MYVWYIEFTPSGPGPAGENERAITFTVPTGVTVNTVQVGGEASTFTATGIEQALNADKTKAVTFKVETAEGVTLDSVKLDGTAISDSDGVYTIPASDTAQAVTFEVTSNFNHAAAVSLDVTTKTVKGDLTPFTLTATVTGEDSSKPCTDTVTWTSSNPAVATVSETGEVTPKAIGATTITAEAGGKTATCAVAVVGADQNGPSYTFESKKVAAIGSIAADFAYDNYFTVLNGGKFDSSNQNWTDGYSSGLRYNGGSISTSKQAIKFTTTKNAADIKVWWRYNKPLQILDAEGNNAYTASESSAGNYVSTYTAKKAGTWYVGGKGGAAYIYKIEVTEKEAVTSVTLTHGHTEDGGDNRGHTIYVGGTAQGNKDNFSNATLKYPGSWKMDVTVEPATADQSIEWSVAEGSENLITVDQNGVVSPVGTALGTGVVVATSKADSTKLAHCDVTVAPYIEGVVIDKTTSSVAMGGSLTLSAALTLKGGVTAAQLGEGEGDITWTSSDTSVLTVNANGVITPVGVGNADVTATVEAIGPRADDVSDSVKITVAQGTLNMGVSVDHDSLDDAGGNVTVTVTGVTPNGDLGNVSVTAQAAGGAAITGARVGETNQWTVALPTNTDASSVTYTITVAYNGTNWAATSKTTDVTVAAAGEKVLTVGVSSAGGVTEVIKGGTLTLTATAKLDGADTTDVTYQWNKDGSPIAGETNATLTVTGAGSYTCTVTGADGTDAAGLTKTSTALTITEKLPALQAITVAQKGTVDGVTYTPGATNTLVINGKKTVVFDVTMTPEENDEGGTLDTDLQVVDGQRLVDVSYDATAKTLTVTPARASVDESVPRKLTLKGTVHPEVTWEVMITVKKLAAPATLAEADVTATAPTSAAGKGTITIQNAVAGQGYRYKLASADTWTDTPAATGATVTIEAAPGTYQVRQKVDAVFQNIPGALTVTVPAYAAPSHAIAVDGDISDGNIEVDEEAQEGSTVEVTVTPDDGFKLAKLWYVKAGDTAENAITKTNGVYSFTMPDKDVTIHATFEEGEEEPEACCSATKPHNAQTNNDRAKANAIDVSGGKLEHWVTYTPVDANGKYDFSSSEHRIVLTGYGTETSGNDDWSYTDIIGNKSNETATTQMFKLAKVGDGTATFKLKKDSTHVPVVITLHVIEAPVATVTYTLSGLTADPQPETVDKGGKLEFTLAPAAGKLLPETVTVTMGGTAVTGAYDKTTGKITVNNVTGNVVVTATAADKPIDTSVSAVTLKKGAEDAGDAISMETGETLTLTADVTATAEATNKAVIWSSDKPDVVKVENGVLTALKAGTAVITATSDANINAKDSVTVTVASKAVVIGEGLGCALDKGGEKALTAKVMVGDAEKEGETITWSSSSAAVASVTADGKVAAVAPGVAVITATNGTLSDTYTVVVYDSTDTADVKQLPGTFEIDAAADPGLAAAGTQAAGAYLTAVGDGMSYNSGKKAVDVGAQGKNAIQFTVTGKADVSANVKSTGSSNHSAVALMNVATGKLVTPATKPSGASVSVSNAAIAVVKTETVGTVTWTGLPAGTYQLLSPAVAELADEAASGDNTNNRGVRVTKLSVVQAAISAEDLIATAVTVTDPAGKTAATMKPGATLDVSAHVAPATAPQDVTWTVDEGLTKVENGDGTVTVGVSATTAPGTYKVTATSANGADGAQVKGEFTVTVPVSVTGVTVTADATEVEVRGTVTLTATVAPENATEKGVTWTSGDAAIATVDQSGVVTGKGEGKVTITATSKDNAEIKGEIEITVKPATVTPGSSTYDFDPTTLTAAGDKEAVSASDVTDPFGATSMVKRVNSDGNVYAIETSAKDAGAFTFTVPAGNVGQLTVVVASTGGENTTNFQMTDASGAAVANEEGLSSVTGASAGKVTLTYKDLAPGTYTLAPAGSEKPLRVYGANATLTAEGGEPTPADKTYKISVDAAIVNGVVTTDKTEAKAGVTVTVTATAATGYELDAITVTTKAGAAVTVTDNKFTMPGEDVVVSATFKPVTLAEGEYLITCDTAIVGGAVTAPAKAKAGDTVTVTANAETGYELVAITVTTKSGAAVTVTDNKFTMPEEDVTVSATFTKTAGSDPDPVDKTAFDAALAAAKAIKTDGVKTSADGKDVLTSQTWVTQAVKDALAKAIADAEAVQDDATQDEIDALTKALTQAVENWKPAAGTKTLSGGGGLSPAPASRPATTTASTTTVNNPAGGKTTVKKDAQGNVTITATDDKGEVIAEVKLPAAVPAVGYKFVDVPEDHWAEKSINTMAGLGLVKGVNETQHIFDMVSPITRGSVATILSRLANGKADVKDVFSDVAEGQWFAEGVAWAAKAGVVNGFEDGTFQPDASITREQLAVMLARYAKLLGLDTSAANSELAIFTDADDIQSWALEGMAWCVKAGIVNGRGDGTVDPRTNATRAEATAMLARLVDLLK